MKTHFGGLAASNLDARRKFLLVQMQRPHKIFLIMKSFRLILFTFSVVAIFYAVLFRLFLAMGYATPEEARDYGISLKFHKNKFTRKFCSIIGILGGHRFVIGAIGFTGSWLAIYF